MGRRELHGREAFQKPIPINGMGFFLGIEVNRNFGYPLKESWQKGEGIE
jgi:hypothetical protein